MLDWHQLVRDRLALLDLDSADRDEVCSELAAHLEDAYTAQRAAGVCEPHAVKRTLQEVTDWEDLQRQISVEKNGGPPMQKRLRQLWIPGFLILMLAMLWVWALHAVGLYPRTISWRALTILLYAPWLLLLPFLGALGAFISARSGGSRTTALLASTFPALALTLAFLLMFPIGMVVERVTGNDFDFKFVASVLLRDGIGWLLLPLAALFVGGLLAQLAFGRKASSPTTANS